MSTFQLPLPAEKPVHHGLLRRYREALAGALRNTAEEWIIRRAIDELSALDDRMLRDIGLTRSEIESTVRWGRRRRPYY